MHKLVGPRLPERRQVRLAQLSETFLQFIVGQSVNNDQTFALSRVGYRGYGKDLFGRAGTYSVINRLPSFVAASIKSGPNSRRFEELRSISSPTVNRVWPNLKVVSCWADGHATGAAQQLAQSLGSVVLQPKGLIATEGIISISFEGRHPLAIRSHYLEFEDDSGHLLLSSELQEKHEYNVILTTGGGLCGYCLDELPLFVLSASPLRCRTAWEKNYLTDLWHRYFRNFLRVCRLDHHSPCWRPMWMPTDAATHCT